MLVKKLGEVLLFPEMSRGGVPRNWSRVLEWVFLVVRKLGLLSDTQCNCESVKTRGVLKQKKRSKNGSSDGKSPGGPALKRPGGPVRPDIRDENTK